MASNGLTRRLQSGGTGYGLSRHGNLVWKGGSLDDFCTRQLERIERITGRSVRKVRDARRERARRRVAAGEELQVTVKGSVGSDAHEDDDEPRPLV